jgi:hypothetical protein
MDDLIYAYYPVFTGTSGLRDRSSGDLEHLAHEA